MRLLALPLLLVAAAAIYFLVRRRPLSTVGALESMRPRPPARIDIADEELDLTRLHRLAPNDRDDEADLVVEEYSDVSEEVTGPQPLIVVSAAAQSDQGRARGRNEDAFVAIPEQPLFVVADGMGGHASGEVASRLAIDTITEAFAKHDFSLLQASTRYRRANELLAAIEHAHQAVRSEAAAIPEHHDMGTTVVAARFSRSRRRVYIAHVGDSRAYRIRNGTIAQLTHDHTLSCEAGVAGKMGAMLTRALGVGMRARPEVVVGETEPDDYFVLCTDGLTKTLSDEEIRAISTDSSNLEQRAQALVGKANERGGPDNVTVVLIHIEDARRRQDERRSGT